MRRHLLQVCAVTLITKTALTMASKFNHIDDRGYVPDNLKSKTEKSWFRAERYVCCPWETFKRPGLLELGKWKFLEKNNSNIPKEEKVLDEVLPVDNLDESKLQNPPKDKVQVTWIGHATVLVQFDGITILSDPVFLDYCGPSSLTSYKRYRKAPCTIDKLLRIVKVDAVIISHNHYDHLEKESVKAIGSVDDEKYIESPVQWFVAKDQKDWMVKHGKVPEKNVVELDWWTGVELVLKGQIFKFICTPTQHWCARLPPTDDYQALWCGWVVKGPTKSYYFAGDTGYYEVLFKTIGEKYGPFDMAVLPIGAYEPRWILEFQHVNPAEAVKIHEDIKSKCSIGMHWGTLKTSACEFFVEPPQKVEEEMKALGKNPNEFISLYHGETWSEGGDNKIRQFMIYKGQEQGTSSSENVEKEATRNEDQSKHA